MKFPDWCESTDPLTRAQGRLRYIIQRAANERTGGLLMSFATYCGIDRTSMHNHMAAGRFSPRMAMKIESAVADEDLIRATWLTEPLKIVAE